MSKILEFLAFSVFHCILALANFLRSALFVFVAIHEYVAIIDLFDWIRKVCAALIFGFSFVSSFVFFSLSRYKLKFSPEKIDTMIIQAVCE